MFFISVPEKKQLFSLGPLACDGKKYQDDIVLTTREGGYPYQSLYPDLPQVHLRICKFVDTHSFECCSTKDPEFKQKYGDYIIMESYYKNDPFLYKRGVDLPEHKKFCSYFFR